MKFKNILRMQMMALAGLGLAMVFAGSAYAQQEVDPTPFDDGPYVEPMGQPASSAFVATTSAAVMTPSDARSAATTIASPSQVENAAVWSPVNDLSLATLLVCAACILLYEIAKAKSQGQAAGTKRSSYLPRGASSL